MINLSLEPTQALFESKLPTKETLRPFVLEKVKQDHVMEASDSRLEISFDTPEGDDILVKKIDPENALGYHTFSSEDDYFENVQTQLYRPSAEELNLNG